jgi:tetratricopeptide (TPR) repeat protein
MNKFIAYFIYLFFIFCSVSPLYSQTFNELVIKYRELQKKEKYDDMIAVCDTMLAKYPKNEPAITFFNRGNTYRHLKEFKKAVSDYTKTIEIKPDYASAYTNRANSYYDLEEYEKAISDYSKVIEIKPNNPLTYYNRANAYSFLFDYDRAISDYSKTIELKPDFADAYYNRGNKYFGIGSWKEAVLDWENAIKYDAAYEKELRNKINEAKYQIDKK